MRINLLKDTKRYPRIFSKDKKRRKRALLSFQKIRRRDTNPLKRYRDKSFKRKKKGLLSFYLFKNYEVLKDKSKSPLVFSKTIRTEYTLVSFEKQWGKNTNPLIFSKDKSKKHKPSYLLKNNEKEIRNTNPFVLSKTMKKGQ